MGDWSGASGARLITTREYTAQRNGHGGLSPKKAYNKSADTHHARRSQAALLVNDSQTGWADRPVPCLCQMPSKWVLTGGWTRPLRQASTLPEYVVPPHLPPIMSRPVARLWILQNTVMPLAVRTSSRAGFARSVNVRRDRPHPVQ